MRNIELILNYLFIGIAGFYSLVLLFDTFSVLINPESYRTAQGFKEDNLRWNSEGLLRYLIGNASLLMLLVFSLYIGIKNIQFRGTVKLWKILYYVLMPGLLVVLIVGYLSWILKGFDH